MPIPAGDVLVSLRNMVDTSTGDEPGRRSSLFNLIGPLRLSQPIGMPFNESYMGSFQ